MRNIIRTSVAVVQGGNEPREVAAAVFLGIMAGFLMGWNASLAIICLLVLILNAKTRVFCQTWLIGAAVSWLLTPLTFHVGYFLIGRTRLGDGVAAASDSLGLVLFDLDRYTMLGGLVAGLAIALPVVWLTYRSARHLHRELLLSRYPLEIPGDAPEPLAGFALTLCRYFYGRPAQARQSVSCVPQTRRARAITIAGIASLALITVSLGGPELIESRLLSRMARANRADVSAARTQLSMLGGRLRIEDLRIADPRQSDRDLLQIGYVTATVRPGPLLRGQVRIDRLLLEDIRSDVPRERHARSDDMNFAELRPQSAQSRAALPSAEIDAASQGSLALEQIVRDWRTLDRRAGRLRSLIEQIERLAGVEAAPAGQATQAADGIGPLGYTEMRRMRAPAARPAPGIHVAALRARALPAEWGLGAGAELEISNLSDNPLLTGQPTRVSIVAPESGAEVMIDMNLHRGGRKHPARCRIEHGNLPALVNTAQVGRVVAVQGGRAILNGEGWISLERIDLPVEVELTELSATVVPGQAPAGVSAEAWNSALSSLAGGRSSAVIEGSWQAPRVVIDPWLVADGYRRQLTAAGQQPTARAFELALQTTRPSPYSPATNTAERVVSGTAPAAELNPSVDQFVVDERPEAIGPPTNIERPMNEQPTSTGRPTNSERPVAIEQPNEIPADFAEMAPNPQGTDGLPPDTTAPDEGPAAEASAAFDPEASDHPRRATPAFHPQGELRYPVSVGQRAGQTPAQGGSPLVQDLRSSRRATPRLSDGTPLRLPRASSPPPPAVNNAPHLDDFDNDVVTRLPAETHVTPPPVGFEIGYDDEPVDDRSAGSRVAAGVNGAGIEGAGNPPPRAEPARNRAASSPKVVQPYWPEEDQAANESGGKSAFGQLADGFRSMFSSQGRRNQRPARNETGNPQDNNNNNSSGNNPDSVAGQPAPQDEHDDYYDSSFVDQQTMEEKDLPGMMEERRSPQRQPQQQSERTARTDDEWYRFWR